MQTLSVLGATGSIGLNTLDVVRSNPSLFNVFALTGHAQVEKLAELCIEFAPSYAVVMSQKAASQLKPLIAHLDVEVLIGVEGLEYVASHAAVDTVMAAIVGAAGLKPCLAAAQAGKRILLANKESLVMAGQLFIEQVKLNNATLLPVDSEHNAIFQSLPLDYQQDYLHKSISDFGVSSIILTGSGGPFRDTPLQELASKTPAQAVAHPNWSMGQKISVDSATMMNKGLEFIEACYLFSVAPEFIEVLIHPQSVIHSMVRYQDGSVLAQMGQPDMRTPIAHTMGFPERLSTKVQPYDFVTGGDFSFSQPCEARYPNLYLAKQAFKQGQETTTVLNAANEVNVAAFLNNQIGFTEISQLNQLALETYQPHKATCIEAILSIDTEARHTANQLIAQHRRVN
ncbi:1-deoxy-D-xylulose-5-phosphate reductoisomerase [Saccharobesus litoralis]|uniref:1-deoxy-D-xylulose 5-phosphate reductoisomerase n=1 Tax=Saccharobesus litoralis TaxID=2172099 RepID=A0A2S0VV97_9ALTE|nr:1-deoxy-D-xylulose-5-phosphate reductoisomerase [Saccharobesus litoralis]AWB68146.1 1-deoxy-D-xylulose-5-phosphate reductoisomerase [Saccharobesus litoralis]